jgi:hypothetical protein
MIVEERVYTMIPGGTPRYIMLWNQFGREAQIDCLGAPLGVYTCEVGDLNTLTYLWQYASFEDRSTRRDRLQRDERFAEFRGKVRELVVRQRNRILTPVQLPEEGQVK